MREPQAAAFARDVKASVERGYGSVAAGWARWRHEFGIAGAAVTEALIRACRPAAGMRVLDVGCGVGEPALTLAGLVTPGEVVAVDLVPEMVQEAFIAARFAGVANVTFGVADAEDLPFLDASFDRVTSRGAIMHFPDSVAALREAHRVLRPGGRAAFTALGPAEETPVVRATLEAIRRHSPPPAAQPAGPDVYRFSVGGTLGAELACAGFADVDEEQLIVPQPWPGTAEEFWRALPDHALGFGAMLDGLADEEREEIASEAIAALREYERDGVLHLTAPIVVASGRR